METKTHHTEKETVNAFGRAIKYVVMPVESVRTLNIRSDEEVIKAQATINDDMLHALENMVKAARSNKLEGKSSLLIEAVAW